MPAVARAIYVKCSWSAVKWMTIANDHDYNDKKINTVFPTILKVEFCLGIDKEEDKRCAVFV